MNAAFANCASLTTLDISGWNTANVKVFDYMFISDTKLNLDISRLRFDSATEAVHMFHDCNKLNGTLNMNGAKIEYYDCIFLIYGHEEGLQITLNYTAESESVVDAILADSYTTAHVVKGRLIS